MDSRRPVSDTLSGETFPIGLWYPPPLAETTAQRYEEIAEAGFTVVTAGNGVRGDISINHRMLEAAAAAGLMVLPEDTRLLDRTGLSAWHSDFVSYSPQQRRQMVDEYLAYPSFAGFSLFDEPAAADFAEFGRITSILRELAPNSLAFINLFPIYASPKQLGVPTYTEYLRRYAEETRPALLSFDHYPLRLPRIPGPPAEIEGLANTHYFLNWALIRRAAQRHALPVWVFIQAIRFSGHRQPTEAELRWQVNVSLAYGAKGIQYFTYWTVAADATWGDALRTNSGEPTPLYYQVQRINTGHLRHVGKALLPLTSESVTHANDAPLPPGAEPFHADEWLEAAHGSAVILGRFRRTGDHENERWLLVVNRSFAAGAETVLRFAAEVTRVFEFGLSAGSAEYRPLTQTRHDRCEVAVSLDAGAARLYLLQGNPRLG